jgi:sugar lactone lactonase YvrE
MALRRNSADRPTIQEVSPLAAIPGGDFQIRGKGFVRAARPLVTIGDVAASLVVSSDTFVIARVPEGVIDGELVVHNGESASAPQDLPVGVPLADSLHPVANPAVDADGNVFSTFSGSRGQKTPVAIYKIDPGGTMTPFLPEMMNATGLAFDRSSVLHVSSRFDGIVYQVSASGVMSVYVEGMGVATGIAFDSQDNLFVGDRSGTIFKISPSRQIYVFATLEPSISAYHLTFGTDGNLYVTGPTTSSFDCVYRVSPQGEVGVFYRGLGRPQGMAFDRHGMLYVAASLAGRRGVVKVTPSGEASLFLSGPNIVGLAFTPTRHMVLTTTSSVYRVAVGIEGKPLP